MNNEQALGAVLGRAVDLVQELASRWERAAARAVWFQVDQWPDLHRHALKLHGCFTGFCVAAGNLEMADDDLALDVSIACRPARYERDIAQFTTSIIESNDQLLALYEMAASRASILTPEELASNMASEAQSVTRSSAALVAGPDGLVAFAGAADLEELLQNVVRDLDDGLETVVLRQHGPTRVDVIARRMHQVEGAVVLAGKPGKHVTTPTVRLIEALADRTEMLFHLEDMHATEVRRAVLDRDANAASQLVGCRATQPDADV